MKIKFKQRISFFNKTKPLSSKTSRTFHCPLIQKSHTLQSPAGELAKELIEDAKEFLYFKNTPQQEHTIVSKLHSSSCQMVDLFNEERATARKLQNKTPYLKLLFKKFISLIFQKPHDLQSFATMQIKTLKDFAHNVIVEAETLSKEPLSLEDRGDTIFLLNRLTGGMVSMLKEKQEAVISQKNISQLQFGSYQSNQEIVRGGY